MGCGAGEETLAEGVNCQWSVAGRRGAGRGAFEVLRCEFWVVEQGRRPPVVSTAGSETRAEQAVVSCGAGEETSGREYGGDPSGARDPPRTRSCWGREGGETRSRERIG